MSVLGSIGTRETPQSEQADPRQVKNSAGGYTFTLDDWARLDRFLILGVDGGTYYVGERPLALDNVAVIDRCLTADWKRTIDTIVAVSTDGRAAKNDPALFALARAAAHPDVDARRYALDRLPKVARIGTHLFHFLTFAQNHRGWGPALTKAVARWYTAKTPDALALQVVKYRQRDGWSHRDVLRKSHPHAETLEQNNVLRFAAGKPVDSDALPKILEGYAKMAGASDAAEAAELVREYELPWETVPSDFLKGDTVWRALLDADALPLGAMLRNLGVLTNRGVTSPGSDAARKVAAKLTDQDALRKARIHPVGVLNALVTYTQGVSRGGVTWSPNPTISDALDAAFYASFGNVQSTGKRVLLALDVSGSMTFQPCTGAAFTPRVGATAMAMVTAAVEPDTVTVGFSGGLRMLDISPRRRLDDNLKAVDGLPFDRTDCALPMIGAIQNDLKVDTFIIYTDNETWAGRVHPHQALAEYRQKSGIDAKLIVVGMTSTGFTIADPSDPGMLDVVGFDTNTPQAMASFAAL